VTKNHFLANDTNIPQEKSKKKIFNQPVIARRVSDVPSNLDLVNFVFEPDILAKTRAKTQSDVVSSYTLCTCPLSCSTKCVLFIIIIFFLIFVCFASSFNCALSANKRNNVGNMLSSICIYLHTCIEEEEPKGQQEQSQVFM
jgi:hypothetical protein